MQSNLQERISKTETSKFHVAIIMDGNGRWAQERTLSRTYGHKVGMEAVKRVVMEAPHLNITMLTLFAFSSDNWKRPEREVTNLVDLFRRFICSELATLVECNIRLIVIGRRDRLSRDLVAAIDHAQAMTRNATGLTLRIAFDYSARHSLIDIIGRQGLVEPSAISSALSGTGEPADVDLMIRTSGEQRLSDFLLWENAYAELYFCLRHWPEFTAVDLREAVEYFHGRNRRFGALPADVGHSMQRSMIAGRH